MNKNRARQRNSYCTAKLQAIITKRTKTQGMSRLAFMAAPAVDPTRPHMDVTRAMEPHRTTTEAARRVIAHLPSVPPETAMPLWKSLHGRISFLVRKAMDDILEEGRRDALEHHLDRQFGPGEGARRVAAYLERTGRDDISE